MSLLVSLKRSAALINIMFPDEIKSPSKMPCPSYFFCYRNYKPKVTSNHCLTTGVNRLYSREEVFPEYRYEEVDFQPIYRFIFQLIKAWGLDYHYYTFREEFNQEWKEVISSCPDDVKNYMYTHDAMELMDAPPIVAAYLDVYRDWPEGYL